MGLFITFEGIEGCGKTTQLNLAAQALIKKGYPVLATAEPGGTALGKKIREVLLGANKITISPEAELFLFLADRAQHIREVIRPALTAGKVVLCDRFFDATMAYQGYGRGLSIAAIRETFARWEGNLYPDLTFLFDLKVDEGLHRLTRRTEEIDRMEREEVFFHQRVREGYLTLAGKEPQRIRVIEASPDISSIHEQVMALLEQLFREKGYDLRPHSRP